VFAEPIPELVNWQRLLEGWEVRESQYLKSFEDRGEAKGEVKRARTDLLEGLRLRFGSPVPEPVRLARLDRWFQALFTLSSWAEFEALLPQH
jgi:hypothetical protein